MKELIHGSYMGDENFITVFTDDTMYQIAQNSGEWAYRKVGSVLANGVRLQYLILKRRHICLIKSQK